MFYGARVPIHVYEGDLALVRGVDAVVNAAHRPDLRGGRVSASIWRAAGPMLARDPGLLGGCYIGEVKLTPGYKLQAPWIIHTQRPLWHGGNHGEIEQLRHCYRNAFALAKNHGFQSLAFPVIGSGSTGFPFRRAAIVALEEAGRALAADDAGLAMVVFAIPDDRGYDLTLRRMELFDESESPCPGGEEVTALLPSSAPPRACRHVPPVNALLGAPRQACSAPWQTPPPRQG